MRMVRLLAPVSVALLGLIVSACSDEPAGPSVVAPALVTLTPYTTSGYAGSSFGPIGVTVIDEVGDPLEGVQVEFEVTTGGGTVEEPLAVTNARGVASTPWRLGTVVGTDNNSVTVKVRGYAKAPPVFTVSVVASYAVSITVVSGDGQSGMVGTELANPLVVMVRDSFGNPAAGSMVVWSSSLGGWLSDYSTVVGPDGTARTRRTLGREARDEITTASVGVNPPRRASFASTASAFGSAFDFDLAFMPSLSPSVTSAIGAAAAQWSGIIIGDLPGQSVTLTSGQCLRNSPAMAGRPVDDVLILVEVDSIDGPGGQLGRGTPCVTRPAGFTTVVGVVIIDSADVSSLVTSGLLERVAIQQVGHALGFGTAWTLPTPPLLANAGSPQPYFTGQSALGMFERSGGTGRPGVRQTAGGVWVWAYEDLMGASWNLESPPNISYLTVAAFRDMSYEVSYANALPFSLCNHWYCAPGSLSR